MAKQITVTLEKVDCGYAARVEGGAPGHSHDTIHYDEEQVFSFLAGIRSVVGKDYTLIDKTGKRFNP